MRPLILLAALGAAAAPAQAFCPPGDKACQEAAANAAPKTSAAGGDYTKIGSEDAERPHLIKGQDGESGTCGGPDSPPCQGASSVDGAQTEPQPTGAVLQKVHGPGTGPDAPPADDTSARQLKGAIAGFKAGELPGSGAAPAGSALGAAMGGAANGLLGSRNPPSQAALIDQAEQQRSRGDLNGAASSLIAAGRPDQAEPLAVQALAREPKNSAALATLAVAQAQQGRADEALASAKQALSLDPHNALAGLIVGHSEEILKGGAAAAKRLTGPQDVGAYSDPAAAGRTPFDAGAGGAGGAVYAGGGAAPARAGPQPEAPLYDSALPLSTAQQLTLKALDLHKAGDDQGALLALTQAVDQEPNDAPAYVVRAEVQNALQAYTGALADAKKAQELAPNNLPLTARALRAQSYARLQTGDWAGALASASRALELDNKSGLGYLYRGMAEDKLGQTDAAARDLAQAVSLDGSLQALALPLLKKYGLTNTPLTAARVSPKLLRGGLIAGSLLLVLLGLLGTSSGRKAVTTAVQSWRTAAPAEGAPAAAAEVRAGDSVGGYRLVKEIGRGGMGVVYEALDETLQRRVAIKRMQAGQGADLERFLREARLVAQLKHPHVAEIYNVLDAGAEPLLVFEFVDGRGLDQTLRDARRLQPAQARRVVSEVCDALAYAHGRGIIHRDLKPANVMIAPDGSCKVMDFGIAHQSTSGRTMTQTVVCGTPVYMAPEQAFGSVSKASDLFSLGVMTYELLTGHRPFDGDDFIEAKTQGRFRPVTELAPALPRALDAFFARALAPDPSKRFSGAAEFRDAFSSALDSTPVALS